MGETKRIQDRIIEELKLDPIDQEVVVLYKGEKERESPEFWEVSVSYHRSNSSTMERHLRNFIFRDSCGLNRNFRYQSRQ